MNFALKIRFLTGLSVLNISSWRASVHCLIPLKLGSGYFIVKTMLPPPFLVKKLPHGCKAKRKTASNFPPTERQKCPERPPKVGVIWVFCFFATFMRSGEIQTTYLRPIEENARSQNRFGSFILKYFTLTKSKTEPHNLMLVSSNKISILAKQISARKMH